MAELIEDVKEQRFVTEEYSLQDGSDGKAVEYLPASSAGKERSMILSLDDSKVATRSAPY